MMTCRREVRGVRPLLLVLLWIWGASCFLVVDLFLNAEELDTARPRSRLYEGMREAAHEMVGEPYSCPFALSGRQISMAEDTVVTRTIHDDLDQRLERLPNPSNEADVEQIASLLEALGRGTSQRAKYGVLDWMWALEPPELRLRLGEALAATGVDSRLARELIGRIDRCADDEHTASAICLALGGVGSEAIVPDLLSRVEAAGDVRVDAIATALGSIGGDAAERALLEILSATSCERVRLTVVAVWPTQGIAFASTALPRANAAAQASIVEILGRSGDVAHVPLILNLLATRPKHLVVEASLVALGRLGDPVAVDQLLRVARERRRYTPAAEHSLAHVRNEDALEILAERWNELGGLGRIAVLNAIAQLPRPAVHLRHCARRALGDGLMQVRSAAAAALARENDCEELNWLGGYLKHAATRHDRLAAVQALRRIGTRAAAKTAMAALGENPGGDGLSAFIAAFERTIAIN